MITVLTWYTNKKAQPSSTDFPPPPTPGKRQCKLWRAESSTQVLSQGGIIIPITVNIIIAIINVIINMIITVNHCHAIIAIVIVNFAVMIIIIVVIIIIISQGLLLVGGLGSISTTEIVSGGLA